MPLLFLALVLIVAACGDGNDGAAGDDDRPTVVATTTILGDIVGNVVGDDARVIVLTPVGVDPHDFQASAAQIAQLNEAGLVVANGLGLEEGLEDVLAAAQADGANVLEIGPLVDPLPFADDEHTEDEDEEHEHGSYDPHVWFDPIRMAEAARAIAAALELVDAGADWAGRTERYVDDLTAADQAIMETLSAIPDDRRRFVTNHDSLGYFADHYDFEIIGTVIPAGTTLAEPSSDELARLIELMTENDLTAIFAETTQPAVLAETVAGELGSEVAVVELFTGSLGEPGSGADTLIGMLETNAMRIAEALAS